MANIVLQQTTTQTANALKLMQVPPPPSSHPGDPARITLVSPGGSGAGGGLTTGQTFPSGNR